MWQIPIVKKGAAALLATVLTALGVVPTSVILALTAAAILIIADTVSGVVVAIYRRDLKSSKLRRLIPKLAQYAGLGLLGLALTLLTGGAWMWLLGALYAICGIEVLSITENLTKLQAVGANLGPAQKYLERVSKYLADGQDQSSPSKESASDEDQR